jgi:hypothetical protein
VTLDIWNGLVELIAVVLGILLALWVNNWNERRKQRSVERGYLLSLRDDLDADREALAQTITFADGVASTATSLLSYVRGSHEREPNRNLLLRQLKRAGTTIPFRPTSTTFRELSGGGGLSLISDRALLRSTIAYYAAADETKDLVALAIRRIWYDYYDALATAIDPVLIPQTSLDIFSLIRSEVGFGPSSPLPDTPLPDLGIATSGEALDSLRGNTEFERALALVLDSSIVIREWMTGLQPKAEELRAKVDEAIRGEHATV